MHIEKYGVSSFLAAIVARQATPAPWTYQGCFLDNVSSRTLSHYASVDNNVQTIDQCTSWCDANGYNYAGLEYGAECFCDYTLSGATKQSETECSMPCRGNSTQKCGNGNRLSIYYNGNFGPYTNPGPSGGWLLLDCYTDSASSRTLRIAQSVSGGSSKLTVAKCTSACASAGYTFAGVEYGGECYCDQGVQNSAPIANGCTMLCSGNSTEYCGGSNRINVYQATSTSVPTPEGHAGWTTLGCFSDDAGNRTLSSGQDVAGGASNMTIEGCMSACKRAGFSYAGVEYAQECFCGNLVQGSGACAVDQSSCYQPCKGSLAETCGGPNRLNVFYSGSDQSVIACSVARTSASSTRTSSISSTLTSSSSTSRSSTSSATSSVSVSSTPASSASISSRVSTISLSSAASSSSSVSSLSTSTIISSSSSSSSTTSSATPSSTVCPSFWTNVVVDLAPQMRDNGQCNNLARAAIRYAFHDSGAYSSKTPTYSPASGGADGSLLLSATEINRVDHDGLRDYHNTLKQKFAAYKAAGYAIGAADLIQVASAVGTIACPGGRIGRVLVGRTDTTKEAPDGLLPQAFGPGSDHDTIFALFTDKGFSARDLAALIGAHSTSIANFQTAHGISAGTPQDNTPGKWDVDYYSQTVTPPAGIGRFDSDINLSKNITSAVGKQFRSFINAQPQWGASFASAWQTLSLLGIPRAVFQDYQDCTNVVSAAPFTS